MQIISQPLQWYVDKLKKKEYFTLSRYGDGELLCMWGRQGRNSNKCRYTPHLRQALLNSMRFKEDPSFIYGLQRVLPGDEKKVLGQYPDTQFYDSEVFSIAVAEGKLYPLIEQLRKMDLVIIGNESIRPIKEIIPYQKFIEVPPYDAYEHRDRVINEIREYNKPAVYLFSTGMAACAFVAELHNTIPNSFFIDIGHIWDPFTGLMSRCDLKGKTKEDIEKNLKP